MTPLTTHRYSGTVEITLPGRNRPHQADSAVPCVCEEPWPFPPEQWQRSKRRTVLYIYYILYNKAWVCHDTAGFVQCPPSPQCVNTSRRRYYNILSPARVGSRSAYRLLHRTERHPTTFLTLALFLLFDWKHIGEYCWSTPQYVSSQTVESEPESEKS